METNNWGLLEDNARPQKEEYTLETFRDMHINVLTNWPPYSPDLSPIEIIWAIMGKRVEKARPKTIPELIQILNDVWYNQINFHTKCV